jgi:hypothetical protein
MVEVLVRATGQKKIKASRLKDEVSLFKDDLNPT